MATAFTPTDQRAMDRLGARGDKPAHVRRTGSAEDSRTPRFDYRGHSGQDSLQELDCDSCFDASEEDQLALQYPENTGSGHENPVSNLLHRRCEHERSDTQSRHRGIASAAVAARAMLPADGSEWPQK